MVPSLSSETDWCTATAACRSHQGARYAVVVTAWLVVACGSGDGGSSSAIGGQLAASGGDSSNAGMVSGGATSSTAQGFGGTGTTAGAGGDTTTGGVAPSSGASAAGSSANGGTVASTGGAAPTGGARASGGTAMGGTNTTGGAVPTGGSAKGGNPTAGSSGYGGTTFTGGSATGGNPTAGSSGYGGTTFTGGSATGGNPTAGSSGYGGTTLGGGTRATGGTRSAAGSSAVRGLAWPIDCVPGDTCVGLGYPDIDDDGKAFDCGQPGYQGHQGTDIGITSAAQDAGTSVWAAADGEVLFAFDGKYDRCPDASHPDCQNPSDFVPGARSGTTVCTPLGPYCGVGTGSCFWCFAGGNVIVIRHTNVPGIFATRYDHLKRDSVAVRPGDKVTRGQKIAEVGSAGNSSGPHLHFEVWGTGFYELADPWAGSCGPNYGPPLWTHDPPWGN